MRRSWCCPWALHPAFEGSLDLVDIIGAAAHVQLASGFERSERVLDVEFATGSERPDVEYISADGAVAFTWPGVGQSGAHIFERLQPVGGAVAFGAHLGGVRPRFPARPIDWRDYIEQPPGRGGWLKVVDDLVTLAAPR